MFTPDLWQNDSNVVTTLRQARNEGASTPVLMAIVERFGYNPGDKEHSFRARLSEAFRHFPEGTSVPSGASPEAPERFSPRAPQEPWEGMGLGDEQLAWVDERRRVARTATTALRKANRQTRLEQGLQAALADWKDQPMVLDAPRPRQSRGRVVCALLSDLHVGMMLDAEESGERYCYSTEEFYRRFDRWKQQLFEVLEEEREAISALNIWALGDWVEGVQKRPSARTNSDVAATSKQAVLAARAVTQFLFEVRARFAGLPIFVEFLDGNHDMADRPGDSRPYDGWGMVIAEVLKAATASMDAVTVSYYSQPYAALRYWDTTVLLVHGHGAKGGGDNPFGGIQRMVDEWQRWHGVQFSVVALAHFHRAASWYTKTGTKVIMNGAFSETSSFGMHLGMANPAIQKVLVIDEKEGVCYERDLDLRGERVGPTPLTTRIDREGVISSSRRIEGNRQPAPTEPGLSRGLRSLEGASPTSSYREYVLAQAGKR